MKITISLFVENLPERLHWKGLWFAFARHGEVVNVYIARKKSRGGKRFGFVRMKNLEEADRVTQRLNGAIFYGSRLVVKIARDNRGQGWKRNTTGRSQSTEFKKTGITMDDEAVVQKVRIRVSTEEDIGKENFKRIIGHVENEDLWNLRRCLVGVMDMVCSVSSIHSRLLKWGLGDINVQRLGAKTYLLTIMDEELSQMLEDVNWSYLKEIFSDVIPWSEKTSYIERATWLEIRGLPLHCWNSVSLKKVADLWGVFEALGENVKHSLDCEKATVLISTNQVKKIDEVIEVEIGDRVFQVGVKEIGFNDGTLYPLCNQRKKTEKSFEKSDESVSESVSDLKLDSEKKRLEAVEDDRSCSGTEVEVLNAMCAEKDRIKILNRENEICGDKIIEAELMGGVSKDQNLTAIHGYGDEESNKKVCSLGHDEKLTAGNSVGTQRVISVEKVGQEITKADGSDNDSIGVSLSRAGPESKIGVGFKDEFKSSWANMLDETLNSDKGLNLSNHGKALSDGENEKDFFAELEERKGKKKGKETKKFGSLLELQNKSITAGERRKRDKSLRSRKWSKQFLEETELSGKSLSDSDIKSRVSILVKEAKQVLNLGKKIGITIVGDENEAIKELVSLELDKGEYDDEEFASRTLVLAAMKAWGDLAALNFPLQYYGKDLEELKGSTSHEESILDCAMADWLAKDGQAGTKCSNPGGEVAEWLCFALSCGLVVSNFCNSS
ncbi:hypothetical protein GQ457_13G026050 [Hibiscus cannabinus]